MRVRIPSKLRVWCAGLRQSRFLRRFGHGLLRAAALLLTRRVVVSLLMAALALELAVLGVGVSRRIDMANERAQEIAREQLAVIEAREMQDRDKQGYAGIGGSADTEVPAAENDPDAPPPLRPRDVETIVAEEGGGDVAAPEAPVEETQPAESEALKPLSAEDREELDILIRKAVTSLTAGDMKLCILTLEEARGIAPNHPAMLYYYGLAYDKLQNPQKARDFYTQVFRMRDEAGVYFQRASRRLTYGAEQPSAMRGKLSFGPVRMNRNYDAETGERVELLLPVMLAPGEDVRPEKVYIGIQFFDLVNGRKIAFCRVKPEINWQHDKPDWSESEEDIIVTYTIPPLTEEELDAYGDLKFYGYTAKLYYDEEPLDCISSPSALILHEQRLNSRRAAAAGQQGGGGLLPDDGLDNSVEEAMPVSDFLEQLANPK